MITFFRRLFCRHPKISIVRVITWGGKDEGVTERTDSCLKCGKAWNLIPKDEIEITQA